MFYYENLYLSPFFCIFVTKLINMRFSVITINYNNDVGLRHTVESVVLQNCSDFEFIIIDGGSDDGSIEVIEEYQDSISYWVSESDRGIYHAMNKGVSHASGDYCIFMNSGDRFYSADVLEKVLLMGCTDDIVVGNVVSSKDNMLIPTKSKREMSLYHLYSGSIPHQAAFIRTSLLRKYPYDENLKIVSDWKFFLQSLILNNCSFCYIDEIIAIYEVTGISSLNSDLMRKEKDNVLKEMFPVRILSDYSWLKSSECMTSTLTPQLKMRPRIDRLLYMIGRFLLKLQSIVLGFTVFVLCTF